MGNVAVAGGPIGLGNESPMPKIEPGVSAPAEKAQEAPPRTNEQLTQEQVKKMIEDAQASLRAEYEGPSGHLARVRSDLARSFNEREREWGKANSELETALHSANLKGLSDQDRAVYERDVYKEQSDVLRSQVAQAQADLAAARSMGQYVRGLQEGFGIDPKDLNLDSVDDLSSTAFTAAVNKHRDTITQLRAAEDKVKTLELQIGGGKPPVTPAGAASAAITPPAVTTVTGVTQAAPTTLLDMRKALSVGRDKLISEEELFELAENPEETGVDLNVVLESLRNELSNLTEETQPQ